MKKRVTVPCRSTGKGLRDCGARHILAPLHVFDAVRAALLGPEALARLLDKSKYPTGGAARAEIIRQASLLKQSDVIVLNEVDWGVKRTGYRDVAGELAALLSMNYAWGVEFVEVDPLTTGTERFEEVEDAAERAALVKNIAVDKTRARNLHGTAILSRYPLANVRLVPFERQGYDWYAGELKKVSKLEEGKRKGSALVFGEKITREVRRGGRKRRHTSKTRRGPKGASNNSKNCSLI